MFLFFAGGKAWRYAGIRKFVLSKYDAAYGKKNSWAYAYMLPLKAGAQDDRGVKTVNDKGDWGKLCSLCHDKQEHKSVFYGDTKAMTTHLRRKCVGIPPFVHIL